MTIRQISEAAGCHIDTVRKIARPMFPMVKSKGRGMAIDYDENQSIKIMERLPKRNMVQHNPLKKQVQPLEKTSTDSLLTEKDLDLISSITAGIVSKVLENLNGRMNKIETRIDERQASLPAPDLETRQKIVKIVNEYCGSTGAHYRDAWNELYKWYGYYNHCNVRLVAKKRDMKVIDYIDSIGMIENLLLIALKYFYEV